MSTCAVNVRPDPVATKYRVTQSMTFKITFSDMHMLSSVNSVKRKQSAKSNWRLGG